MWLRREMVDYPDDAELIGGSQGAPARSSRVSRKPQRVSALLVFVTMVSLGASIILTVSQLQGDWSFLSKLGVHQEQAAPSVAAPSTSSVRTVVAAPPVQETPVTEPSRSVVDLDVPTLMDVRREGKTLFSCKIDGVYQPVGHSVDPPGDNVYLMDPQTTPFSKVGDGQRAAVLVGHGAEWNDNFCFTKLRGVVPGDMIGLALPTGVVTFVVNDQKTPEKGAWNPEVQVQDVLYAVSCINSSINVIISAHRTSSHRTV